MEGRPICFGPEHFGVYLSGRRNFLRYELLLDPDSSPDPFVRVRGSSRFGALYLGRLRSNDGALDRFAVLKVLADGRGANAVGGGSNASRDRAFLEEYRALRLLREGDPDPLLRLAPFDVKTDGGVDLPRLLPLMFCRHRQLFFNPLCAQCATPLRDCRDEALLVRSGLGSYEGSGERYLHCPRCAAASDATARFYAQRSVPAAQGRVVSVGDGAALVKALGELASRGPAGVPEFPCAECSARESCFPAGRDGTASSRLVPFSFHDFYAFIHEFLPLRWGEVCDLLGGRREAPADGLGGAVVAPPSPRLVLEADAAGRATLESLLLRLRLCRDLYRGALDALARFGTPHAALEGDDVWVGLGSEPSAAPSLWGLKVRLAPPEPGRRHADETPQGLDLPGLGTLTLQALVGNRGQPAERIRSAALQAAAAVGARRLSGAEARAGVVRELPLGLVDPANLAYEGNGGAGRVVSPTLWRRTLELAGGLLVAEGGSDASDVLESAIGEVEALSAEIHRLAFLEPPCPEEELLDVVRDLVDDAEWLSAVTVGGAPARDLPSPLFGTAPSASAAAPASPPRPPLPRPPEETIESAADLEATVVLGRRPPAQSRQPEPSEPIPVEPEPAADLEATVVLGRNAAEAPRAAPLSPPASAPPPGEGGEEDLEGTVILSPGARRPGAGR